MLKYIELGATHGERYLSHVWNLFFKAASERGYFPEPWGNQLVRDCSIFRHSDKGVDLVFCGESAVIEELLGDKVEVEAMLYGAYNQINVCQMRALGTVSRITSVEQMEEVRNLLREQVGRRQKMDTSSIPMTDQEVAERLTIIESQPPYRFVPMKYAYMMYERG